MARSCCSKVLKSKAETADKGNVAALLPARLSRLAVPALALLLSTAGLTSAASNQQSRTTPSSPAAAGPPPALLVVPDVRGQAYVFAKGMLQDAGFAWKVNGAVNGFPANLVAAQSPVAGTRLVDTGAPMITLRLDQNAKYAEDGAPENFSPFAGTRLLRPAGAKRPATKRPATKPAARHKPAKHAATKPKATPKAKKHAVRKKTSNARPRAFRVAGAPKEPLNEMPLPRRARLLGAWLTKHPRPTDANVTHWLYQHAWIVTGAKFGWWHGAEALRILIAVDRRVMKNWGIGTRSHTTARAALAEVKARAR
jgi:hypothetical protein